MFFFVFIFINWNCVVFFIWQILSSVGIALTFEFGFDYESILLPEAFCAGETALRYCVNNVACNTVVILVSGVLVFVDLARACLDNRQVAMCVCVFACVWEVSQLRKLLLAHTTMHASNWQSNGFIIWCGINLECQYNLRKQMPVI